MRNRTQLAAAGMAAIFLAIYLPDLGNGFISDDFRWIVESRANTAGDVVRLFRSNIGFYRPLVALTFAVDYALWGTDAFGYGLTNLFLLFVSAVALFALARAFTLPAAASLVTVAVWIFNFHAVNMSLLWISARTALLACTFSLATAVLFLQRRFALAGVACLAAMLSKEEAVALPPLFAAYAWLSRGRRSVVVSTWPLWVSLFVYLGLRVASGAFWPTNAPPYYAFTHSPTLIARNVLEYADRAGTVAAVVALVLLIACRTRRSQLLPSERDVLLFSALWIPATFALTVLVPVRSSLYALLPSIGSALAAGVVASAASRARPNVFAKAVLVLLLLAAVLIPVYRSRNVRWTALAIFSEQVMTTLVRETAGRPGGYLVLIDSDDTRVNLRSAFGGLFPEAARLRLGTAWSGEIVAEPEEAQRPGDLTLRLSGEVLSRE
jgi:hypothetical protein